MMFRKVLGVILLFIFVSGCALSTALDVGNPPPEPRSGFVNDMPAFDDFIATRPTTQVFRQNYPDVQLVLPGDITTKEFRMNNSRYFAVLDGAGRITGGRFQ
ncbi:MAG: hypothetical protein ABR558_10100 [Thioalkalivibrio sp.]